LRKKLIIILFCILIVSVAAIGISSFASFDVPVNNIVVITGNEPTLCSFLASHTNRDDIDISILSPIPDWTSPGRIEVTLGLTNARRSFRTIRKNAYVHILEPVLYVEVEVDTPVDSIRPQAFLSYIHTIAARTLFETQILTNLEGMTNSTGQHHIELSLNDAHFSSILRVIDTTPPEAITTDISTLMGVPVFASRFITYLFDHSPPVTVQFKDQNGPDIFRAGQQTVEILVADYYGNTAIYTATLTVLPNYAPPQFIGVRDLQFELGSAAMFRQGVSATDAFGREIDFTVDSGMVDIDTLGVYYITYRAEDSCGNYTEVTARVYIVDVDPEQVRERANTILERILYDGMTQVEQTRAIFDWITVNVGYAAGFEHRTVYESANEALVHRRGDCFVFYSISELLLTMAGIPNMRIDRVGGNSRHVWNLINPDGLGWHHFDTTPLVVRQIDRFMFTQTQAEEFTEIIHRAGQGRDYFTFDPELYPEIVRYRPQY